MHIRNYCHTTFKSKACSKLTAHQILLIEQLTNTSIQYTDATDHVNIHGINGFIVIDMMKLMTSYNASDQISDEEINVIFTTVKQNVKKTMLHGLSSSLYSRSTEQAACIHLIQNNNITFISGSAGTGKTYIAVSLGLNALVEKKVNSLVLSRPVVNAGENLGFLPGNIEDKLDPYLKPLYDELLSWISKDQLDKYIAQNKIELCPLAYMRGRTFKKSWVILDEGQNATKTQIKMLLTRIGLDSKIIITGDTTQIDFLNKDLSGLKDAIIRLDAIESIGAIELTKKSIVRHPIISSIIDAYQKDY